MSYKQKDTKLISLYQLKIRMNTYLFWETPNLANLIYANIIYIQKTNIHRKLTYIIYTDFTVVCNYSLTNVFIIIRFIERYIYILHIAQ